VGRALSCSAMTSARTPLLLLVLTAGISIAAGRALAPGKATGSPPPPPTLAALPPPSHGARGIEPDADRLLRAMTTYLASLQSFTVLSAATDEVVLGSGQKIQLASESLVAVQRPNKLRSEQVGPVGGLAFWYDGKDMTLACRASGTYATMLAPKTIDATIDEIRKTFRIDAPGADLLYSHPYEILTEQVTGGRLVGRETIDSVETSHLAFEGEAVDWQIWIQEGSQPLPLRFVVTTKGIRGQPQFTVRLTRWEPGIRVPAATFAYEAPVSAQRVSAFPVDCQPAAAERKQADNGLERKAPPDPGQQHVRRAGPGR